MRENDEPVLPPKEIDMGYLPCNRCHREIKGPPRVRVNYPYGKKSRPKPTFYHRQC